MPSPKKRARRGLFASLFAPQPPSDDDSSPDHHDRRRRISSQLSQPRPTSLSSNLAAPPDRRRRTSSPDLAAEPQGPELLLLNDASEQNTTRLRTSSPPVPVQQHAPDHAPRGRRREQPPPLPRRSRTARAPSRNSLDDLFSNNPFDLFANHPPDLDIDNDHATGEDAANDQAPTTPRTPAAAPPGERLQEYEEWWSRDDELGAKDKGSSSYLVTVARSGELSKEQFAEALCKAIKKATGYTASGVVFGEKHAAPGQGEGAHSHSVGLNHLHGATTTGGGMF